jgi:formiminoglutamase
MLYNWLEAVDPAGWTTDGVPPVTVGNHVLFYQEGISDLSAVRLALVGIHAPTANLIRQELYSLSWAFDSLVMADLGNARKEESEFLLPMLSELLQSGVFPLLLGSNPQQLVALYQALDARADYPNLVLVDERLPLTTSTSQLTTPAYLNAIVYRTPPPFAMGLLGAQAHFLDAWQLKWMEEQSGLSCLRLGRAKAAMAETEPLIRDGDLLGFHLRAINGLEMPAQQPWSPSGFSLEEACQLCRYAGMSDKLRAFSLHGFSSSAAVNPTEQHRSAQAVAQMLWYFMEGFYHRKNDYPASVGGLTEYIVDLKDQDDKLVFWKSNKSGRWWLQAPNQQLPQADRHRLIPCTYDDYLQACRDELSERVLAAYKRG